MAKFKSLCGAWSAAPTPLTASLAIDKLAVKKMIAHHIALGLKGLFLGGTCGEGPFLTTDQFRILTRTAVSAASGKIINSVQVTDNSFSRVLENIRYARQDGADIAIIAEPLCYGPLWREASTVRYFFESVERSSLPVGIYIKQLIMPHKFYERLFAHPNICLIKDSSVNEDAMRICLDASKVRPELAVLTGYEWDITKYLQAGYGGVLAGGGILIGALLNQAVTAAQQKDFARLTKIQQACNAILWPAYGGKKIKSWLTGLKYTLTKMGIFNGTAGYLQYLISESDKKRIDRMIATKSGVLFPNGR